MGDKPPRVKGDKNAWDAVCGFGEGLWDSVASAAEGIYTIVTSPVETVKGIGNAIVNYEETCDNIINSLDEFWDDNWTNGDLETRSMVIGRVIGEVALCIVGTKGADKVSKSVKAAKVAIIPGKEVTGAISKKIVKAKPSPKAKTPYKGGSGALLDKKLVSELAESGVKYNVDDVIMVTKTADGKLVWLEKGSDSAGLKHIINNHATNFADRGITDIPKFLEVTLKSTPTRMGSSSKGMFAEYIINGKKYTVAYGNNGFIVSFYPSGK